MLLVASFEFHDNFYGSKIILDRPNRFGREPISLDLSNSFWLCPNFFWTGPNSVSKSILFVTEGHNAASRRAPH